MAQLDNSTSGAVRSGSSRLTRCGCDGLPANREQASGQTYAFRCCSNFSGQGDSEDAASRAAIVRDHHPDRPVRNQQPEPSPKREPHAQIASESASPRQRSMQLSLIHSASRLSLMPVRGTAYRAGYVRRPCDSADSLPQYATINWQRKGFRNGSVAGRLCFERLKSEACGAHALQTSLQR
jgi:hypothetical protein